MKIAHTWMHLEEQHMNTSNTWTQYGRLYFDEIFLTFFLSKDSKRVSTHNSYELEQIAHTPEISWHFGPPHNERYILSSITNPDVFWYVVRLQVPVNVQQSKVTVALLPKLLLNLPKLPVRVGIVIVSRCRSRTCKKWYYWRTCSQHGFLSHIYPEVRFRMMNCFNVILECTYLSKKAFILSLLPVGHACPECILHINRHPLCTFLPQPS